MELTQTTEPALDAAAYTPDPSGAGSPSQDEEGGSGKGRLKGILILVAGLLPLVIVATLVLKPSGALSANPIGQEAPGFTLPTLEGGDLSLSDLRGQGVMLNFWASWCIPCKKEAPTLAAGWERWQDKGVVFLGVDEQDSVKWAKEFHEKYGLAYESVFDEQTTLMGKYGVTGFPETFFIDKEGVIVEKWVGPLDAETLDRLVAKIATDA